MEQPPNGTKASKQKPGPIAAARDDSTSGPSPDATKKAKLSANGLTGAEANTRLEKFGLNAMPDTSVHPLRMLFEKFWAPVPWMLEAAIVLELALGKYVEASII